MKSNTYPSSSLFEPYSLDYTSPLLADLHLITNLPESKGYDSVIVVVDHGLMKG